jgi:UDP-N-acetylglucosamine 1-carboxyvinyltransferase
LEKIIIEGGTRLIGDVPISGSKNSALPLFAASILCESPNTFHNVPKLRDIATIQRVLQNLGVRIVKKPQGSVQIDSSALSGHEAPYDLVKTMRASILVL